MGISVARSYRLSTFGRIAVEANDGRTVSLATQRKALALLAFLGAHGPRGVSRDKILAVLWPDSNEEQGRNAFAQLLFRVRRELGPEAILGEAELRLNAAVVACDVAEFDAGIAADRLEDVIELYKGDFLDGFFLRGASEFERWVEDRRQGLRHRYGTALERVARRAQQSGDLRQAADWWRRRTELDPMSADTALCYIDSLVAAGSPDLAIRHADVYAALVRSQLDIEPDARVMSRAREIRSELARPVIGVDAQAEKGESRTELEAPSPVQAGFAETTTVLADTGGAIAEMAPTRRSRAWPRVFLAAATLAVVGLLLGALAKPRYGVRSRTAGGSLAAQPVLVFSGSVMTPNASDPAIRARADRLASAIDSALDGFGRITVRRRFSDDEIAKSSEDVQAYRLTVGASDLGSADSESIQLRFTDLRRPNLSQAIVLRSSKNGLPVEELNERLRAALTALIEPWRFPTEGPVLAHELPPSVNSYRTLLEGSRAYDRTEYGAAIRLFRLSAGTERRYGLPLVLAAWAFRSAGLCDSAVAINRSLDINALASMDQLRTRLTTAYCAADLTDYRHAAEAMAQLAPGDVSTNILVLAAITANNPRLADSLIRSVPLRPTSVNFNILHEVYHALGDYRTDVAMLNAVPNSADLHNESWRLVSLGDAFAAQGDQKSVEATLRRLATAPGQEISVAWAMNRWAREYDVHGYAVAGRAMHLRSVQEMRESNVAPSTPRQACQAARILLEADSLDAAEVIARAILDDTSASPIQLETAHGVLGIIAALKRHRNDALRHAEWLAERERHLELGNPTMWRARIVYTLGDRETGLMLARSAISRGYYRWLGGGDEDIEPVHQIKEFSSLASEGAARPK